MNEDRPRIIERQAPAQTPEEARGRRSSTMIGVGAIALIWGLIAVTSGSAGGFLLGLLGIGLLVGGLVIRR